MEDFILTPTDKFFKEVRNTLNSVTNFLSLNIFRLAITKPSFYWEVLSIIHLTKALVTLNGIFSKNRF